ncbi:MAG: hypothetical protein PVG79_13805, partial [Gemmatimonadales bacterium]
ERITFLHGRTERLTPPGRADVLVFEDFAPHLYHPETAEILLDVKARWLSPGAASIPRSIRLLAAPVCCPETYAALTPWPDGAAYGLQVGRLSGDLLNQPQPAAWRPGVLLGEPTVLAREEPLALDSFGLDREVRWAATRAGELHGIGLWIDLELADGVVYSNAPSGSSGGWGQQLLPLVEPLRVEPGDEVVARVMTLGPSPQQPEWWSWRVTAPSGEREGNTFRGTPLSSARLRAARLDGGLRLTTRGRQSRAMLELMDGSRTLAEIARELLARYPDLGGEREVYRLVARELDAARAEPSADPIELAAEARSRE